MKELYPSHPDMFTITWVQNFCRNRSNMSGTGSMTFYDNINFITISSVIHFKVSKQKYAVNFGKLKEELINWWHANIEGGLSCDFYHNMLHINYII